MSDFWYFIRVVGLAIAALTVWTVLVVLAAIWLVQKPAHSAEWDLTAAECQRNPARYGHLPSCIEAQRRATGSLTQRYAQAYRSGPSLQDPQWWANNPAARSVVLMQCARRAPGDEMVTPYCGAAGLGAMLGRR